MTQISLLIRIKADPIEVFNQVATAEGIAKWFTEATLSKNEETDTLQLQLWGETDFIVTELSPPTRIVWHCTSKDNPWFGTDIIFAFSSDSGKTVVTFDHAGWPEVSSLFRDCAMSWAYFLESLRSLIEDGKGTPEEVAPPCEADAT
jgi:uncharacterized protein YndB with AHSA1/START domain